MDICARCNGVGKIKVTDPVLFRSELKDCPGCINELKLAELEKLSMAASSGFVWADFDLDFELHK